MHQRSLLLAMALAAACLQAAPLDAQTVYRCANSYSDTPCQGAIPIAVDDRRSPAQKAQTDAATARAAASADRMEHERLARERAATGAARPQRPDRPSAARSANNRAKAAPKKNKAPELFTAAAQDNAAARGADRKKASP